jgi:hypothetical protein
MRVSWVGLVLLSVAGLGQGVVKPKPGACRRMVIEGEVAAGRGYEKVFGGGLKVGLEPIAEGWAIRVMPARGPRDPHDSADLASPPYRSLSPLIVSTGLGFRAQDAVGWNPRRFRYAGTPAAHAALEKLYERVTSGKPPSPADDAEIGRLVAASPEGTLEILDAGLIPGTADQVETANAVAVHFLTTAHQIDQPADGKGTPLGKLEWIRFRFSLDVPRGMTPESGIKLVPAPCSVP